MPMINGIPIPYGNSMNANYGLLGGMPSAQPSYGYPSPGMGAGHTAAGSPLGDALALLRARSLGVGTPPPAAPGPNRMPPMMPIPPIMGTGGQPPGAMTPMGAGGKPPPPLFWGENATFPETGDRMSDWLHQLMGNASGFFSGGGGGSQFPNWTGSGNTNLNPVPGGRSGQGMFNF